MEKLEFVLLPITFRLPAYTWDEDRKACQSCGAYSKEGTSEMCTDKRSLSERRANQLAPYCIDARSQGAPCGPSAALRHPIAIS